MSSLYSVACFGAAGKMHSGCLNTTEQWGGFILGFTVPLPYVWMVLFRSLSFSLSRENTVAGIQLFINVLIDAAMLLCAIATQQYLTQMVFLFVLLVLRLCQTLRCIIVTCRMKQSTPQEARADNAPLQPRQYWHRLVLIICTPFGCFKSVQATPSNYTVIQNSHLPIVFTNLEKYFSSNFTSTELALNQIASPLYFWLLALSLALLRWFLFIATMRATIKSLFPPAQRSPNFSAIPVVWLNELTLLLLLSVSGYIISIVLQCQYKIQCIYFTLPWIIDSLLPLLSILYLQVHIRISKRMETYRTKMKRGKPNDPSSRYSHVLFQHLNESHSDSELSASETVKEVTTVPLPVKPKLTPEEQKMRNNIYFYKMKRLTNHLTKQEEDMLRRTQREALSIISLDRLKKNRNMTEESLFRPGELNEGVELDSDEVNRLLEEEEHSETPLGKRGKLRSTSSSLTTTASMKVSCNVYWLDEAQPSPTYGNGAPNEEAMNSRLSASLVSISSL